MLLVLGGELLGGELLVTANDWLPDAFDLLGLVELEQADKTTAAKLMHAVAVQSFVCGLRIVSLSLMARSTASFTAERASRN